MGEEVARDFGEEHGGIFYGKVASVTGDRRVLYRVEYTDGDQEDLDEEQYAYAHSLAFKEKEEAEGGDSTYDPRSSSGEETLPEQPKGRRRKKGGGEGTQHQSAGIQGPKWHDVGGGEAKRFKPVVSRAEMDEQEAKPKFKLPCKETNDISPEIFCRFFLSDELVEEIAKNSERYRKKCAVCVNCCC